MNSSKYAELRKDPRWQRKRLEIMERDGFACKSCGSTDRTLNVHHRYYVKDRFPWAYPGFALMTLCAECHDIRHSGQSHDPDEWENLVDLVFGHEVEQDGPEEWDFAIAIGILCNGGASREAVFQSISHFLANKNPKDLQHVILNDPPGFRDMLRNKCIRMGIDPACLENPHGWLGGA